MAKIAMCILVKSIEKILQRSAEKILDSKDRLTKLKTGRAVMEKVQTLRGSPTRVNSSLQKNEGLKLYAVNADIFFSTTRNFGILLQWTGSSR